MSAALGRSSFFMGDALPGPTIKRFSVRKFYKLVKGPCSKIDINGSFHRDVVWSSKKQSSLIESLLSNIDLGQITLNITIDTHGNDKYTVIDGKQRLMAIVLFLDGAIPITSDKLWAHGLLPVQGSSRKKPDRQALDSDIMAVLRKKKICVCIYHNLTAQQTSRYFTAVQSAAPLSSGEKLQALTTDRSLEIGRLVDTWTETALIKAYGWKTKRRQLFRLFCFLVYACHSLLTPTTVKVAAWLEERTPFAEDFITKINMVFRQLLAISKDPTLKATVLSVGGDLALVETIFAGVILFTFCEVELLQWRAITIMNFRRGFRSSFSSTNLTIKKCEYAWAFVRNIVLPPPSPSKKRKPDDDSVKSRKRQKHHDACIMSTPSKSKRKKTHVN